MEENEGKEKKQKKKMQPKRWLAGLLGIFLAGLAGCMALVIWVDPFFQYHKPLAWFPYLVDNQVNQNPGLAKHMDYDGILIGSSMTASFNTNWFEELMGMKTQKLSYNGSYPKDLSNIMQLVFDAKGDQVKAVYMAVDQSTFSADPEETKFPVTDYLYDDNVFNDVPYLLNKDVLLDYILRPLADRKDASDWAELYKPWWTDEYYNKANVLMYYEAAEEKQEEEALAADYFKDAVEENLQKNILPYIEAHPETEFYIFYPPYSILFWNDVTREKELEAVIGRLEYMTERLLNYENVHVFNFLGKEDIICNLNNYADYMHYHKNVCRYITECFATGENELHPENYGQAFDEIRTLAMSYDYPAIWDDWYDTTPRYGEE
ncbi:hypothetical protein [Gallintestinimicrobium sp.]|uniref:hypothetical protein n=1 Tax=Gallintestinimicrobium sp. TaxID=2981655 RepID=UPI00307CA339